MLDLNSVDYKNKNLYYANHKYYLKYCKNNFDGKIVIKTMIYLSGQLR